MTKHRKEKKPKTKRSRSKYPALDPSLNIKIRYDEIADFDYLDKLNDKEKEWLNKFNSEYINDVIDRKHLEKNLHNTPALKKSCDDRNNSRNRDVLSKSKVKGELMYLEDLKENSHFELQNSEESEYCTNDGSQDPNESEKS